MLGKLQDYRGEPKLRVRLLAALVILGIILLSAPIVMIPIARWLVHQV
jgi:hypothetical protein